MAPPVYDYYIWPGSIFNRSYYYYYFPEKHIFLKNWQKSNIELRKKHYELRIYYLLFVYRFNEIQIFILTFIFADLFFTRFHFLRAIDLLLAPVLFPPPSFPRLLARFQHQQIVRRGGQTAIDSTRRVSFISRYESSATPLPESSLSLRATRHEGIPFESHNWPSSITRPP